VKGVSPRRGLRNKSVGNANFGDRPDQADQQNWNSLPKQAAADKFAANYPKN